MQGLGSTTIEIIYLSNCYVYIPHLIFVYMQRFFVIFSIFWAVKIKSFVFFYVDCKKIKMHGKNVFAQNLAKK